MKTLIASFLAFVMHFAHCEEALSVSIAFHTHQKSISMRASESIILAIDIERTEGRFGKSQAIWEIEKLDGEAITPILKIPLHGVMTSECDNWHQTCAKYTAPAVSGRYTVLVREKYNPSISARIEVEVRP